MLSEDVEALGLNPIHETLAKLGMPKDPPLRNKASPMDLAEIAGTGQRLLGLDLFLNFYISEDIRDTTRNRMMVNLPAIYHHSSLDFRIVI